MGSNGGGGLGTKGREKERGRMRGLEMSPAFYPDLRPTPQQAEIKAVIQGMLKNIFKIAGKGRVCI